LLPETSRAFNYTTVPLPSASNPLIRDAESLQTASHRRPYQSLFDAASKELGYARIDQFQINQLVWKLLLARFKKHKSYCAPPLNRAPFFNSFSIYVKVKSKVT
jgi:hypothetical protein